MMVMVSNLSGGAFHYLAGKYPGRVGHLYSPEGWRKPKFWMPYALDNGCFTNWDEAGFLAMIEKAKLSGQKPLWVVVPDVVGNREQTLERWAEWEPRLRPGGIPLAFACQDGMAPDDVPKEADIAFVGGSLPWKWRNLETFCRALPRVHVGRVNEERMLWMCDEFNVESVDGTGWWHDRQLKGLMSYLDFSSNGGYPQKRFA